MGLEIHDLHSWKASRRGFLAATLALLLPGRALASATPDGEPSVVTRDRETVELVSRNEQIGGARTLQAGLRSLPPVHAPRFNLVGLHWQGKGHVWFRTSGLAGGFGPWEKVQCCGGPDADAGEETSAGWHLGTPAWTGPSERIQYRLSGEVQALRAHFVWSPPRQERRLAVAETPFIIARSDWGADDAIVRAAPRYSDRLTFAIVHHTAGREPETPEESAAVVRGIQNFHVKGNRWNDIGYNFLIDRFGQVFEGRGGGVEQSVIGAHARGFNTGSVGIAVLGHFEKEGITHEARDALARFLAWRLDVGHVDPLAPLVFVDGVARRAVSGHRDVNSTICPGEKLWEELEGVAAEAQQLGLPKLFEARVEGSLGAPIRLMGRLSEERSWNVSIVDELGSIVAGGTGIGSVVDFTWDATPITTGAFTWTISAGDGIRAASGVVRAEERQLKALPPPPARPSGIPRRIPRWAWQMHRWHSTPRARRGARPAKAPRKMPKWYYRWRRWRLGHERYARLKKQRGL